MVLILIVCLHHVSMHLYFSAFAFSVFLLLPSLCLCSVTGSISPPYQLCCHSLPLTCSSFFSYTRPLPLLDRTLIFCDVKLITPPLFPLSSSLSLRGVKMIMVDDSLGGLCCGCICVCGSENDGMLRDRWKVRRGAQTEASVCHLLSALFSSGCVTPVSSVAQYGIIQYLRPRIIRVSYHSVTEDTGTLNYMSHVWI